MGTYGVTPITPGTGADIKMFTDAASDIVQVVRKHKATAVTTNTWTVSTTASTSQIAADVNRVRVLMKNTSTGVVYLRFDSTAPTSAAHHTHLEPQDRYEVPEELTELAVSMLGASANGSVVSLLATAS